MSKKINTKLDKGEWVVWEDGVEVLLRPFPISLIKPNDDEHQLGKSMFNHCVINIKGIEDEFTGKDIKITDEIKEYLYDYFPELTNFVANYITKSMNKNENDLKNLKS